MKQRYTTTDISTLPFQNILLDANIWLYVFCPLGNYSQNDITIYSQAFKTIIKTKKIVTDIVILSEVINRWLRLGFDEYKRSSGNKSFDYKRDYRTTAEFTALSNDIKSIMEPMLLRCVGAKSNYNGSDINTILQGTDNQIDLNDRHIIEICKLNSCCLLTHDADFKEADIPIISENYKLRK